MHVLQIVFVTIRGYFVDEHFGGFGARFVDVHYGGFETHFVD